MEAAADARQQVRWILWWPAIVMMLGTLLSYVDRASLALLSPMFLSATNMTAQDYSWCISAFSFAYMFSALGWGSILDRIGLRLGMTISLVIWMLSSASHALVGSFLGFAVGARGARHRRRLDLPRRIPHGARFAADRQAGARHRAGLQRIVARIDSRADSADAGRDPLRMADRVPRDAGAGAALAVHLDRAPSIRRDSRTRAGPRSGWFFPNMRERRFWSLVASYALGALPVGAIIYLTPLYLSRAFGLTPAQLGFVLWIPPAGLETGYFFWGWIADRFERASPRPVWLIVLMALLVLPLAAVHLFNSAPMAIALLTFSLFAAGRARRGHAAHGRAGVSARSAQHGGGHRVVVFFGGRRAHAADLRSPVRSSPVHRGLRAGGAAADRRRDDLVAASRCGPPKAPLRPSHRSARLQITSIICR